uniref:scavenger receptor cysteine-rich type 1 protein M160-like n=1 Tax=Centroberyx gerrardi TaxID=166262 RepID=UPI003AACD8F8
MDGQTNEQTGTDPCPNKSEILIIGPNSLTRSAQTFSLNIDGAIVTQVPSTQVRNLGPSRFYLMSTRSADTTTVKTTRTKLRTWGDRAFSVAAPSFWNALPNHIRQAKTLPSFKQALKTHFFKLTFTWPDDVRLVGGASRCAGRLEVKQHGDWKPVDDLYWSLKSAAVVCRQLGCGSVVSTGRRKDSPSRSVWLIRSSSLQSGSTLRECVERRSFSSPFSLKITCSESVRLVNGTSLCSGRLEVKSKQFWSSVCEADFDQQDAEVVCRELGCGAPSVLQGALYGEVEAPMWTKEFQCEGSESVLLDCGSSGSARNTCSPGKAVGLTCSEPDDVRLVGGASRCAGGLEMKQHEDWGPVGGWFSDWDLRSAAVVCRQLDCGSAVSTGSRKDSSPRSVWRIRSSSLQSGSTLRECVLTRSASSSYSLENTCSESVRLVNGNSLCSGRLEVKSNQSWSSVCEADFDQQDAEVVCRELGCGAPSVLQGALYGEVEAPMWTEEFQCEGNESILLDCGSSGSARNTCSPGKAVGLTCSEPDDVRLVGGASRCAGGLEMKQNGDWKPVDDGYWNLKSAAVVCRQLDCGSAISTGSREDSSERSVWLILPRCDGSESALRECVVKTDSYHSSSSLELICSDLLVQPIISLSPSMDGVSEAQQQGLQVFRGSSFTISCSIQPQYPGGSFHLTSTASNTAHNHTLPAVNHSAHFVFPAAEHAHQGIYSCVYHISVFSHNFSSESQPLSLTVSDITIRLVVLLLAVMLITAFYFYFKATRGQTPGREENIELDYYNLGGSGAEGGPGEEAGAQGTE